MNLNELREAMASDATKENAELKKRLKSLQKKYDRDTRNLREEVKALREDCRALGNRCFVFTQGGMCMFCQLRSAECRHMMPFGDSVKAIEALRRECEEMEGTDG